MKYKFNEDNELYCKENYNFIADWEMVQREIYLDIYYDVNKIIDTISYMFLHIELKKMADKYNANYTNKYYQNRLIIKTEYQQQFIDELNSLIVMRKLLT